MAEDPKAGHVVRTPTEFLSALERHGVLPDAQLREVKDRFGDGSGLSDTTALARRLIKDGLLTEFQARRLLKGKGRIAYGRYILIDHVGRGARGQVFKARHRLMDRLVALKVIRTDSQLSKTSVARFFREMKMVALLDHPNVVRAIDADVQDGSPYIVMEYIEGVDLEEVDARKGPLPVNDVLDYMAQVCRGLGHAHDKGVIHRDVKPTNLFLAENGVVKLLDLGLGELVGPACESGKVFDTDEGIVVGTTDYMAPEQIRGKPIDARTDLFGLGCTMYRLLTGEYAFPGLTREDRLVKRIREGHVPINDVRPEVPATLARVIDRLLALRPEDRFESAVDVAESLEALLPSSARGRRGRGGTAANGQPGAGVPSVHSEEESLDWSMIESALRPSSPRARPSDRLVERDEPRTPPSRSLASHRKELEEEGVESGREVHEKYRNELIQMNRVMAELRSVDPSADEDSDTGQTWAERLGEKVGDYLAEPSAGLIIIVVLLVLLGLALALAIAVS
jgi:eukaryotic-like serine/threonine-protein kinase